MATSILDIQRSIILDTIRTTSGRDWKVLVLDEQSRRLVYNVTREDDILNANITNIEQIEERRQTLSDTDAIYLLSPLPHIVECLKADLGRKRYRRAHLIWTSQLPRALGEEIFRSESRARLIVESRTLNIDFFPRESNLITFREPWSFHLLYHPGCDALVKNHLDALTQKIVSICVSLGEYPLIRFYKPRDQDRHPAEVLCYHLASFVQAALDNYARDERNDFPPQNQSARPRAVLLLTARSMDLMSPFVHELTYQAMAMDLLPIRDDDDKVTHRNIIRRGQPDQEEKDVEITEKDNLWVAHRHMHMKDLLVKLSEEFRKFQARNPQFADNDGQPASINTIKDMLAGLPEFQEGKEAFSLHIDMAEKCAKIFADHKLLDVVSVEQSLSTGVDEDNKKPKNLADQIVRLLDDDSVIHEDRVRLLILSGILRGDIEKLRCHGELSPMDGEIIYNLIALGARVEKQLKDTTLPPPALFPPRFRDTGNAEEVSLSRFEPALRYMLEEQCEGTLDSTVFPAVKPHLNDPNMAGMTSQTSLRNAGKPTWAQTRSQSNKPRQRIIVFMAGGATYAEARACYEVSRMAGKEIFLATTHMLTPKSFLRQVSLLSAGRKQLDLPADRAAPKLPAWMSEPPPQAQQPQRPQAPPNGRPSDPMRPPTEAMQRMNIAGAPQNGTRPGVGTAPARPPQPQPQPQPPTPYQSPSASESSGKLKKEKKHHLGLFKKH
ncbi:syntaxin binding protein 1 [Elasticomyces elasticus]|uniref:Syntaxin binding protein 1 n=1 Tax=Exophiala sideris TaxID=1016849 RepID=A0ABR0JHW9_9EURO|nr:syntaxin binding protein 1 [Elasticomyces elasticus]KAK5034095.1 syntaxin binding protein 1 [Exophiala sideris]KAK5042391.1 syntaxin binding protein 1 [Exophiala sideris]KAK5065472.1 syntaxin binding protein 1 [Exophiala sideris]KAK5186068.1 syntaxin binding protein 1 [Eurotiomycetes sp. CCFEE 6388]